MTQKRSADQKFEEGLILFARYAFAPNYFRYCGPDKNRNIGEAIRGQFDPRELQDILNHFEAAVPYLNLIARSNKIADPFDKRVVLAYWLGNDLLNNVPKDALFWHLTENVKKRAGSNWKNIEREIGLGAKPTHSFHVIDIYRTAGFTMRGSREIPILELINNCRIGWGVIIKNPKFEYRISKQNRITKTQMIKTGEFAVKSQRVIIENKKFVMVPEERTVQSIGLNLKEGDMVSLHWGFVCDKLSHKQASSLLYWTTHHLKIANRFL